MGTALTLITVILAFVNMVLLIVLVRKSGQLNPEALRHPVQDEIQRFRAENQVIAREAREELGRSLNATTQTLTGTLAQMARTQQDQLSAMSTRIDGLTKSNTESLENVRNALNTQVQKLTESNEKKLDEMRKTVDEKLQTTLERRLGESFKLVQQNLESVQKGLGEMKTLAADVGDFKKVLTNVKTRGTWGEVQLGAILEQILTVEQYSNNVKTRPNSDALVEYAIRLPGDHTDPHSKVWLPIDSKFPQEDYARLVEASDRGDSDAFTSNRAALLRSVEASARDIHEKYLEPPHTTDFGIMFLPTEGLYAEVIRDPALLEKLHRHYRIVVAGPTTLAAILSSLRLGFQTIAIEKRSGEVWKVLGAVKTEFERFGKVMLKVEKQLGSVTNTIQATKTRTTQMERKLRAVERLDSHVAVEVLALEEIEESDDIADEDVPD